MRFSPLYECAAFSTPRHDNSLSRLDLFSLPLLPYLRSATPRLSSRRFHDASTKRHLTRKISVGTALRDADRQSTTMKELGERFLTRYVPVRCKPSTQGAWIFLF
jgi:hypothetical protein